MNQSDFWSEYQYLISDLPNEKEFDQAQINRLQSQHMAKVKDLFILDNPHAIVFFWENLNHAAETTDYIRTLRDMTPENGFLAGMESILQGYFDDMLSILLYYNPNEITDQNLKPFFKEYCSREPYDKSFWETENIPNENNIGFKKYKKGDGIKVRWFALTDHLLLVSGSPNADRTIDRSSKMALNAYAKERYGVGEGFYKDYREFEFDINTIDAFVKCLSPKHRKNWKNIILDICNNDANVKLWLKKQPN